MHGKNSCIPFSSILYSLLSTNMKTQNKCQSSSLFLSMNKKKTIIFCIVYFQQTWKHKTNAKRPPFFIYQWKKTDTHAPQNSKTKLLPFVYPPSLSPPPGHPFQALCKDLQTCRSKTLTHVSLPRGLETDAGGYSEAYINRWSMAKRLETIMRHCDSMHSSCAAHRCYATSGKIPRP